jgi:hypothetical protein
MRAEGVETNECLRSKVTSGSELESAASVMAEGFCERGAMSGEDEELRSKPVTCWL